MHKGAVRLAEDLGAPALDCFRSASPGYGGNHRNAFMEGHVSLVTSYRKGFSVTGSTKLLHRFLPRSFRRDYGETDAMNQQAGHSGALTPVRLEKCPAMSRREEPSGLP
ncbi:hypothetical protein K470DRAFT_271456 [Piedraia hortae CBS 480.64]|uniref:Uncharacterized protein n=1 Tax=Piedraia hortae CBS 480.64 TaxID=1314780 RepID=A0A6A7BWG6_9PEZI|nr:hypothetical protein K470DRAFT_271456 [Piedraia hortae CBS 480.64]